jgi:hypothetical protein
LKPNPAQFASRCAKVSGVGGLQPTAASATGAVGRISLTVGAFFLALLAAAEQAVFVVTVAVMFWFAFSYLTLKPREELAAYRG